jgi:hypothetical protein
MPGGELQLSARGAHDLYLTDNPDISFFKAVYKRYTPFAQQLIELDDDTNNNTLSSFDKTYTLKYKIPRNADLLKEVYLQVSLPAIYSNDIQQFQWIERIGEYMIQEIRIIGDDSRVYHRISSEYLHIYAETHTPESKKMVYYAMIGNLLEYYDPANGGTNRGIYPSQSKPSSGATTGIPSIPQIDITVPIPFWFSQHSGCALPLIALQHMSLRIEVDIRPLYHLYTILDNEPSNSTYGKRIRPQPLNSLHYLNNFTNQSTNNTLSTTNVNLFGNYIFLDRDERKRFAQNEHIYLMRDVQYYTDITGNISGGNLTLLLKDINHPVTQMYFMLRRTDNELSNQWTNYTLWEYQDGELVNPLDSNFISQYNNQLIINNTITYDAKDMTTYDLIKDVELRLEGQSRFDRQIISFFNVNRYNHNKEGGALKGIYGYSFALDNDKFQPSGSCNFSRLGNKELSFTLKNLNLNKYPRRGGLPFTGDYRVFVITENINFYRVLSGMSGKIFDN